MNSKKVNEKNLKEFLYIFKDPKISKQTGRANFIKNYDKDCYNECLNKAFKEKLIYTDDEILNKVSYADQIVAIKLTKKGEDLL